MNRALAQVYASGEVEDIFIRHMGKLGRPAGLLAAMYILSATPQ